MTDRAKPGSAVRIEDPKKMPLYGVDALRRMGLVGVYEYRRSA
jgi:hypothetical protein